MNLCETYLILTFLMSLCVNIHVFLILNNDPRYYYPRKKKRPAPPSESETSDYESDKRSAANNTKLAKRAKTLDMSDSDTDANEPNISKNKNGHSTNERRPRKRDRSRVNSDSSSSDYDGRPTKLRKMPNTKNSKSRDISDSDEEIGSGKLGGGRKHGKSQDMSASEDEGNSEIRAQL